MTKFSAVKLSESYTTFSEGIRKRNEGYALDKDHMIYNESDKVLDAEELTQMLLSKDVENYEEAKQFIYGKSSRFLDGKKKQLNISYTSYPRSGNTFLRKYFESVLGVATGSDMVMLFQLNVAL